MDTLKFLISVWMVAASLLPVAAQNGTRTSGNVANKAAGVSDGQQVVVEKDEFSGATTVKLKPQKVVDTPERLLTMSAESKLGNKPSIGYDEFDERVMLRFDLQTTSEVKQGDLELYFLVDGKSVKGGSVANSYSPLLSPKPTRPYTERQPYIGTVSIPTLRQVARGKRVEMRVGSIEVSLSSSLLGQLNEFVRNYEQAKGKAQP